MPPLRKHRENTVKGYTMEANELQVMKELMESRRQELIEAVTVDLPEPLASVSNGLNLKELKYFKDIGIRDLRVKIDGDNEVPLTVEEIIFDVVVPLLEMRGVNADDLDDITGSDYLSFYNKVEALTTNPKLKVEIEKKS